MLTVVLMKNLFKLTFGLTALASLVLNTAYAQSNKTNARKTASIRQTPNTSTTGAETTVRSGFGPKYTFNYVSFLSGPPISDLRSDETVAAREGYTLGLSLQNQIGVRYWLNPNLSIMPVFDFEYQFTDPHRNGANKGVSLVYDSFIKAKYVDVAKTYVQGNKLSFDAEARYYLPVSEFSRINDSYGSIRLAVVPGINFAGGKWELSALSFYRYWMQTRFYQLPTRHNQIPKNTFGLPEHTFYTGPQISYRASKTFNLWMLFEASYTIDTLGFNSATDPNRSNMDIEPGVDIRIANGVYVSPYLNWYVSQPINTTSINLITSITI